MRDAGGGRGAPSVRQKVLASITFGDDAYNRVRTRCHLTGAIMPLRSFQNHRRSSAFRHDYARMSAGGDRTAWLRSQSYANLSQLRPVNLWKQGIFDGLGVAEQVIRL